MRETKFIEQNKEKWSKFEKILDDNKKDPEELSEVFIDITDDLSYARTHYPNRSVTVYLNSLAQKIFQKLNSVKYSKRNPFVYFWKEEMPYAIYHARKELIFAFAILLVSVLIGAFSTHHDPSFANQILGDEYVGMTVENIKKGDPMAVYKKNDAYDMFLYITINNVKVAFFTFILGVFASVGSVAFIINNGIMLGTFQYFFYQHNLLGTSALVIWQHGTLEIASLVIAGGAGIVLGKGLVFPGTYSRGQSFFLSAQKGMRIMLGVVPIIIMAALIESFYTRYTDANIVVRWMVIVVSLAFLIWYFIWYPYHKNKKVFDASLHDEKVFSWAKRKINFKAIKTPSQVLSDTFTLFSRYFKKIALFAFLLAVVSVVVLYFIDTEYFLQVRNVGDVSSTFASWFFNFVFGYAMFFNYSEHFYLYFIVFAAFSLIAILANYYVDTEREEQQPLKFMNYFFSSYIFKNHFIVLVGLQFVLGLSLFLGSISTLCFLLLMPFFILMQTLVFNKSWTSFTKVFRLLKNSWGTLFLCFFALLVLATILFAMVNSPLLGLYYAFVSWNLSFDSDTAVLFLNGVNWMVKFFMLYSLLFLFPICFALMYFSLKEITQADDLMDRIKKFASK